MGKNRIEKYFQIWRYSLFRRSSDFLRKVKFLTKLNFYEILKQKLFAYKNFFALILFLSDIKKPILYYKKIFEQIYNSFYIFFLWDFNKSCNGKNEANNFFQILDKKLHVTLSAKGKKFPIFDNDIKKIYFYQYF